jgi:hypothetical protein
MQLIRPPKLKGTAERELPELIPDWMNMKSGYSINITIVQKLRVHMLFT